MNRHIFADVMQRIAKGELKYVLTAVITIFAFYYYTAAGNLSETDDVYAFAYRAENFTITHISDPRLMLYHMAMRVFYLAGFTVDPELSALTIMRIFSALCASLSLFLVIRICIIDLKLSSFTAGISAILLGSTYGYWRYAMEAEVYIPSIMLCLILFHLLSQSLLADYEEKVPANLHLKIVCIGSFSGLAILFYQPNIIPLLLAFPILLFGRRVKHGILLSSLYLISALFIVLSGYLTGFWLYWQEPFSLHNFVAFLSQRSNEFMVPSLSLKTVVVSLVRSAFSLSHDIASANWLFGIDEFVKLINRAFSNNVVMEEVYLASQFGWFVYIPIATITLLGIIFIRVVAVAMPIPLKEILTLRVGSLVIWLLIYGVVVGRLNPAGIEAWIMVLPALIILSAVLIIDPLIKRQRHILVITLVGALMTHNLLGGMLLVQSPEYEYDRVKGAWIIEHATKNDLVIVTDNAGLAESMRYLSKANVALVRSFSAPALASVLLGKQKSSIFIQTYGRDFGGIPLNRLLRQTAVKGGKIILFSDFFQSTGLSVTQTLHDNMQQVHSDPYLGSTYMMLAKDAITY